MPNGTKSFFVDANVFLYRLDRKNEAKGKIASEWLVALDAHDRLVLSPQVLNEFMSVIIRRRVEAPLNVAETFVQAAVRWCVAQTGHGETLRAMALHKRFGLQWYDALLLASALNAGCAFFLSEDMQHDQMIDGMRIINPFMVAPADILSPR